jgi:uncharacterized protein DUF1572
MDPATYLTHARAHFASIKRRADRALSQVEGGAFFAQIDPESNSLAHLVRHIAGNMKSRWTGFLTTDGEKPDRRRDEEFVVQPSDSREHLLQRWEAGWAALSSALEGLSPQDLSRVVTIRGEPHSVFEAIERQKDHYAYHAGQIVLLAKHFAGPEWKTLSIPRGASDAYHAELRARRGGRSAP